MSRKRKPVVMIAVGLLCGAISINGMASSGAQEAPPPAPASLFSYDLQAGARGYSMYYEDGSGMRQGEGTVPEASSSLISGPIGLGLASMAWPGPVVANSGSLVGVLSPDAPDAVKELNYPVRAEARTGQEPPTVKNEIPGATMTATATPELVESLGEVESFAGDDGTFGPSRAESRVTLKGATGTSESISVVEKVSLAGGVIKIDSVTSTANATTDGTKSDGAGSTVVSGMTVGGQPATIGEDGLRIGEANQPLNAVANQIAKEALESAGVEMVLGAPTKEVDGPTAVSSAPSLVITWESEGGTFGVVLGGARAAATGSPALDAAVLGGDTEATEVVAPPTAPTDGGGSAEVPSPAGDDAGLGGDTGVGAAPGGDPGLAPPAEETGGGEVTLGETAPARSLSKPVKAGYLLLGLLASLLVAYGMRKLGDEVLAERAASAVCPLDGSGG